MSSTVANAANSIRVSLVIPARDEAATVRALLESIAAQTFQPDEILFVDGGSHDKTLEILREAGRQNPCVRVIEAVEASPGKGRNIGINEARNQWVALTDAGIHLEKDWLENLVAVAKRDSSVRVVYGNYEPVTRTFFEKCAALTYVAIKQNRDGELMRGPSTASMLIHREAWQSVGGFPDSRAAEDLLFFERIDKQKIKVAWAAKATVWWQLRPTLVSTFRKFALYSKHNVWIGRQWDWHYGVARYYAVGCVFILLALVFKFWWIALLAPLGFLLRIARTIWQRREEKSSLEIFNPIKFFMIATILLTIDAATFLGWLQAYLQRGSRPAASGFHKQNVHL
jgi:glycosyltransferase involved in cell wall biosynthesis